MATKMDICITFAAVLLVSCPHFSLGVSRPRGVSLEKASFYENPTEFTCFSDGIKIPKDYVNDDYCDCEDGSDEPGTSACNGLFYCENKAHVGTYIRSSRVDDGLCDCCDGSDESDAACENTCEQLNVKARAQQEAMRERQEKGYKLKLELIQQGKRSKDEKLSRLNSLEQEKSALENEKKNMENTKNEAEIPEKEAIEKHKQAWEAVKAEKEKVKDAETAGNAFTVLDVNGDGKVDFPEIMKHIEFDIDSDGTVSEEEAKEYLEDYEDVDKALFTDKIWPNIKEIYKSGGEAETQVGQDTDEINQEQKPEGERTQEPMENVVEGGSKDSETREDLDSFDENNAVKEEDDFDEDDDDDDDAEYDVNKNEEKKEEEDPLDEDKMPEYDEETNRLITVADFARKSYEDADTKVRDAEREINDIKKYLELDFGPEQEFGSLKGECFEFTDREYIYRFCPFEKTIQKPKNGGMETSLGNWGHWHGPADSKYDSMMYENGQGCWNGPNRSTRVVFHCGAENALTSASEPSRCEYQFDFSTPAKCQPPQPVDFHHVHTEL